MAIYDVVVIGAGPAGLVAALHAARKNLKTAIVSLDIGGQVGTTRELTNYPGVRQIGGPDLVQEMYEQVREHDVDEVVGERVIGLRLMPGIVACDTESGKEVCGRAVIIASGAQKRELGIPGEHELKGRGVVYCSTCDGPLFRNLSIAIVGGGNSGLEAALEMDGVTAPRPFRPPCCARVKPSIRFGFSPGAAPSSSPSSPPRLQSASIACRSLYLQRRTMNVNSKNFVDPSLGAGLNKVALIGNHTPRRCGIATFTADLADALTEQAPMSDFWTIAMNDVAGGYDYPQRVRFELDESRLTDYRLAAEFLNMNQVDVVCLQHEYGIFGGADGRYILGLLGELRMPVVTTLHTVLKEPTPGQLDTLRKLADLSDRLIVLSETAGTLLQEIYGVPEEKIAFIHHGIPDVAFVDPNYYKDQFGVEGRRVILTFGLLSPNKGIEHMVRALPAIVERYPDTVYIVLGVTHPHVLRNEGEAYRLSLQQLAKSLGVDGNIIFQNRFVDPQELREFLGAADVYVTPYVNEAQISSGTLAYAMGSGKAIVSTPYWYAAEMLSVERGRLVPFNDSEAISRQVLDLFDNPVEANAMRKRAYLFGRDAVWPEVAQQYLRVFAEAKAERNLQSGYTFHLRTLQAEFADVPELNLGHLRRLTDHTGILQHATFNVPDLRHGYCTDDNARALIVAALAEKVTPGDTTIASLRGTYLAFLQYALVEETGRFRNFLPYDRHFVEETGSEDSQGRALWGLGVTIRESTDQGQLGLATSLFNQAMPNAERFTDLRTQAMALLGLEAYLERFSGDSEAKRLRNHLAERLLHSFSSRATPEWPWPEAIVTYDNGKIPHALLLAGHSMERDDMIEVGLRALEWLVDLQTENGYFVPVGSNGWYTRDGHRARFDQQPLEAHSLIDACITANAVTGDEPWVESAMLAFQWFLGQNDLGALLYDPRGGCCYDGLQPDGVNLNQGAESTLAWLLSSIQMHMLRADRSLAHLPRLEKAESAAIVAGPTAGADR